MCVCVYFCTMLSFYHHHTRTCLLVLERGREWGREKAGGERETDRQTDIDVGEKHWLGASCMLPVWGQNLQHRHVPWSGIELVTSQFMGPRSCQLSHTGQGCTWLFKELAVYLSVYIYICPFYIYTYILHIEELPHLF